MFCNGWSFIFRIGSQALAMRVWPRGAVLIFLLIAAFSWAQVSKRSQTAKAGSENLEQHYDAARTFQLSGDQDRAAAEYSKFLVEALRVSAKANVALGQRNRAALLFEDALALAPDNPQLRVEFAQLRFQEQNFGDARALAEKVLTSAPDNAQAHSLLGQILFAQEDFKGARAQLEPAVASAPSFDSAYLLGITYIKLNDFSRARLVFDDMLASFGDTAQIHMMFGRAYKQGGWEALENAVKELKLAIDRDGRVPHAHYLLALAYIDRDGESAFPQAASELRTELKISPDDARSHYLLGYVAMKQHDSKNAEAELLRAAELDPKNPDPLVYLGQIYSDADRDAEAEADLRKAITLSGNGSRTDYLIGRAHYILGRVLLKDGKSDEGKRELEASQVIRDKMNRPDLVRDSKLKSDPELDSVSHDESVGHPPAQADVPAQAKEEVQVYLEHLKPAIADSYNNLGVFEAGRSEFAKAAEDFRKAGEWNPSLETLDRNWGMAAFYAKNYQEAVPPLTRQLEKHPEDVKVRAALALSLFIGQNYKATLDMLKPIQQEAESDPGLDYAYSVSLVKVGDYDEGTRRLRLLAEKDPNSADVHMLLGSALAEQREYGSALQEYRKSLAIDPNQEQTHYLTGVALIEDGHPKESVDELRTALKLNPSDVSAKYHLAFSLIQIQQTDEAKTLLREVIQQDPNRADAYYEMGKLQLEQGDTKGAVQSLEAAIKVSPDSDYIHYQLAMAYRRDSRNEDAQREIKLYQSLKDRQRGHGDVPQTN